MTLSELLTKLDEQHRLITHAMHEADDDASAKLVQAAHAGGL